MTPTTDILEIHGHEVCFRQAGSGPVLVLIHGITGSSLTWEDVIGPLAEHHTVIAPDLLGHGDSAKPRGDYSLGAHASGVRDLLLALGHERATVVGHSLGGGVAMQFAYQFPGHIDRLALVASGGLGREVSLLLRSAALPGAEYVLPLLVAQPLRNTVGTVAGLLDRLGVRPGPDVEEMAHGFASLGDLETRQAFIHTVRAILDIDGQRVSAHDRLYLAAGVPSLLIWGDSDRIIPVSHGYAAHEEMPGSRLEVYPNAGHFPHRADPRRFVEDLLRFTSDTPPALVDLDAIGQLMRERAAG